MLRQPRPSIFNGVPYTFSRPNALAPLTVANLALWLDSSYGTYQDSGLSTPAVANNDPVGGWVDRSGLGYNAIQNTNNAWRPTFKTGKLNGLPSLNFDGSNDALRVLSFPLQTYHTAFMVLALSADTLLFEQSVNANSNPGMFFRGTNAQMMLMNRSSATHTANGSSNWLGTSAIIAMSYYDSAFLVRGAGSIIANGTISGTSRSNSLVTDTLFLLNRNQSSAYGTGDLFEVIVYNGNLSTTDQNTIGDYLANKYALTWTH